jgi:hypothetical protein
MAIDPPTAKRAARVFIIIYIGVAYVTTDNAKSSKKYPIITVSAKEANAVVRFIRIVGAIIFMKILFTRGLFL